MFAQHGSELLLASGNEPTLKVGERSVVLVPRKLEAVHAEITALGRADASIVPLDLEKALAKDYEAVAAAIQERYGRLDGLLHNAALLGSLTPLDQYDVPTFMRVMHVNVTAASAIASTISAFPSAPVLAAAGGMSWSTA